MNRVHVVVLVSLKNEQKCTKERKRKTASGEYNDFMRSDGVNHWYFNCLPTRHFYKKLFCFSDSASKLQEEKVTAGSETSGSTSQEKEKWGNEDLG